MSSIRPGISDEFLFAAGVEVLVRRNLFLANPVLRLVGQTHPTQSVAIAKLHSQTKSTIRSPIAGATFISTIFP